MMRLLPAVLLALVTCCTTSGQTYGISTFAGGGLPVNIPGTSASLSGPQGVAVDTAGNIFFTDFYDVLRLNATTGVLTLVAGNGTAGFSGDNGLATSAQLNIPEGVAVDSAGNVYIADSGNNRIRKVTNGVITTMAGNGMYCCSLGDNGPATNAQLSGPAAVAVDSAGNLYIADLGNLRIRKVANGVVTTVAGGGTSLGDNGPATSAEVDPQGVAVDSAGNLYIAGNNRVRMVANGVITTVAGDGIPGFSGDGGPATSAELNDPVGVAVDSAGNLYISEIGEGIFDTANQRVREVTNGVITSVAEGGPGPGIGDNGPATSATLSQPEGVAVDSAGNLYITDTQNSRVRKVANGVISTVAGGGASLGDNGPATGAQLNQPAGVAVDSAGNLYIADSVNNRIRKVANGVITTVAGNGTAGFSGDNGPATSAQLNTPYAVAVDSTGNLYIADTGNQRVREVTNGGLIATVAGGGTSLGDNGPATSAEVAPQGVPVDSVGSLYIADSGHGRIRRVTDGVITTVTGNGIQIPGGNIGDGGPATSAELGPHGVAVDSGGNLYIADILNNRIRKVANGVITTVAGDGIPGFSGDNGPATSAELNSPYGVAVDSGGNLYIADLLNLRIRKVSGGVITTIAGNGTPGFSGDNGPATSAQLNGVFGVAVDASGNAYIADFSNHRVRLLTPGTVPVISPGGIVPVYSPVSVIQPGSWVSIYGSNLASGTFVWDANFPTSLGGVSVTIDNKPAYFWFVSPTLINLQAPDDTEIGPVSVVVTTAAGAATSRVTLSPYAPSFSLLGDGKHVAAEILTPNGTGAYGGGTYDLAGPSGTFSFSARPVHPGETLVLFGVGFGPTTPHVQAGRAFSGSASTNTPVTIAIGGVTANVAFAGIIESGFYQFNVTVPNTGSGDQALQAIVNGAETPPGPVVTVQ